MSAPGESSAPVFVTGGSGFLGRALLLRLREEGQGVRALARSEEAARRVEERGAAVVRGDLGDLGALRRGMRGCAVVYHCAAVAADWVPFEEAWRGTVLGTSHVLEAARAEGVEVVVHVSTEQVLSEGRPLIEVEEDHPYPERNLGTYATTKAEAERRALAADGEGLRVVVVRPRLIWGAGDTTVLPRMVDAVRGGAFAWIGGGGYRTSTCNVENAVEGLLCAAARGVGGEVYHLTDGEALVFKDFATRMLATRGVTPQERSVPLWLLRGAASVLELCWRGLPLRGAPPVTRVGLNVVGQEVTVRDDKARTQIGYRNRVTVEEGLARMRSAAAEREGRRQTALILHAKG